jgi:hypothetical protein
MVHGVSVAQGGRELNIDDIAVQATDLTERWAAVDVEAATRAWAPIQELQKTR